MTSPAIVREALEVKFRRIMADCPPGHSNLSGQLTALREYMRAALAALDATPEPSSDTPNQPPLENKPMTETINDRPAPDEIWIVDGIEPYWDENPEEGQKAVRYVRAALVDPLREALEKIARKTSITFGRGTMSGEEAANLARTALADAAR